MKPATIEDLHPADNVVINETKKLVVICKADGYPPPEVSWLQNGKNLSGQHYKVSQYENEHGSNRQSILLIDSTKYPRDNGTYTCKAKNNAVSQKSVEISIQSKCNNNNNNDNNNDNDNNNNNDNNNDNKIFLW